MTSFMKRITHVFRWKPWMDAINRPVREKKDIGKRRNTFLSNETPERIECSPRLPTTKPQRTTKHSNKTRPTHRSWTRPAPRGSRSSGYPAAGDGSRCHSAQAFVAFVAGRSSKKNRNNENTYYRVRNTSNNNNEPPYRLRRAHTSFVTL